MQTHVGSPQNQNPNADANDKPNPLSIDLWVNECVRPAIDYISTDLNTDSSSCFPFSVQTDNHSNKQTDKVTGTIAHPTQTLAITDMCN